MEKKFERDIDNVKDLRSARGFDWDKDYTDPFNKDDRLWIDMYFIQKQLKPIKWALFIIVILLFIALVK